MCVFVGCPAPSLH